MGSLWGPMLSSGSPVLAIWQRQQYAQLHLLELGAYGLPIFRNGQGVADIVVESLCLEGHHKYRVLDQIL